MPGKSKRKTLWQMVPAFIREDFVRKLIALILATIIYIGVLDRLGVNQDISGVRIPVKPPSSFVIIQDQMPTVTLTVSGSQSIIKRLKPEDFSVSNIEIQAERYQQGKPYELKLRPENIRAPIGVSVVSANPEILRIDIDKVETKEVLVRVKFDQNEPLPPGYKLDRHTVHPDKVMITGPSSSIGKLDYITTEPISLDRITQNFDITKKLVVHLPNVKVSPPQVKISAEISREFEEKTYTALPIRLISGENQKANSAELKETVHAQVMISAPSEILRTLSADDIKVFVDVSNLKESGTYTLPLECWIGKNKIEVKTIRPEKVRVKIK